MVPDRAQGGLREQSQTAWGVTSTPITVQTIYAICATGYVNNSNTTKTPIVVTTNNPLYKILVSAGATVDGLGYVIFGKA